MESTGALPTVEKACPVAKSFTSSPSSVMLPWSVRDPVTEIRALLAFCGIIVALAGRMLLHQEVIVFIGVVMSLIGMMSIAVIPLIAAKHLREKKRRPARPEAAAIAPAEPTMKLPPIRAADDFVPSVTDSTTELLKEPAANHRDRSRR